MLVIIKSQPGSGSRTTAFETLTSIAVDLYNTEPHLLTPLTVSSWSDVAGNVKYYESYDDRWNTCLHENAVLNTKRKYILYLYHKHYTCFCLDLTFYGPRDR